VRHAFFSSSFLYSVVDKCGDGNGRRCIFFFFSFFFLLFHLFFSLGTVNGLRNDGRDGYAFFLFFFLPFSSPFL